MVAPESNSKLQIEAYGLLKDLVRAINEDDRQELRSQFEISHAMAEEIQEIIGGYYPAGNSIIEIAPFESAFLVLPKKRASIVIFEMNEAGRWGAECMIWRGKKPDEPIMHVEFFGGLSSLRLQYKYIGS